MDTTILQESSITIEHGDLSADEVCLEYGADHSFDKNGKANKIIANVILKDKSLLVGCTSGSSLKVDGDDIENCMPQHSSSMNNKGVDGLRREPRAKMSLSPSKGAGDVMATNLKKQSMLNATLNSPASGLIDFTRMRKTSEGDMVEVIIDNSEHDLNKSSRGCAVESDLVKSDSSKNPENRKARKSLGKTARKSVGNNASDKPVMSASKTVPITNMTLQLSEIEKTLGIKTLSKIDAKTLDKLILEKARMPRKDSMARSRTASPDVARVTSAAKEDRSVAPSPMISEIKKNIISIKPQDSLGKEVSTPEILLQTPEKVLSTPQEATLETVVPCNDSESEDLELILNVNEESEEVIFNVDQKNEESEDLEVIFNVDQKNEESKHVKSESSQANRLIVEETMPKLISVQKKRRKRSRPGNYNLPSIRGNKKKKIEKKCEDSKNIKKRQNSKVCDQAVNHDAAESLDDSYETVDEKEVSHIEEPIEETVPQGADELDMTNSETPAGNLNITDTSTPVLNKVDDSQPIFPRSSKGKFTRKHKEIISAKRCKPVLGPKKGLNKKDDKKMVVVMPLGRIKWNKSKLENSVSDILVDTNQSVSEVTSPIINPKTSPTINPKTSPIISPKSSPIINPKTKKPYVRGPYKRAKSECSNDSPTKVNNVSVLNQCDSGRKSLLKPVSPVLEKLSKDLARNKNIMAVDKVDYSHDDTTQAKQIPEASAKAKLKKASGIKQGQKSSDRKANASKDPLSDKLSKVSQTNEVIKSLTAKTKKPQMSVIEMFMKFKSRQNSSTVETVPVNMESKPESLTTEVVVETPVSEVVKMDETLAEVQPETESCIESAAKRGQKVDVDSESNHKDANRDASLRQDEITACPVTQMESTQVDEITACPVTQMESTQADEMTACPVTQMESTQVDEMTACPVTQMESTQVVDPVMSLEHTDPEFMPLEDPVLMDLPSLRNTSDPPSSLAELKATLDAEADQQPRYKSRKRKGADGSQSGPSCHGKRAKLSVPDDMESLGVCPLAVTDSPLRKLPRHIETTDRVTASSTKKRGVVEAVAVPTSSKTKFVNTPNGVQYPVTPPKTPEDGIIAAATPDKANTTLNNLLSKEHNFLPLCCCRINGAIFKSNATTLYCQALDSIDNMVVGCTNKVTVRQLVRPAVKIPFMAICEVHRKRHKLHHCCPGCGHFCTQGTFLQCKKGGNMSVHHFHRQCQVYKDSKYYCPHCGEESMQFEVSLALYEPYSTAIFAKRNVPTQARIGSSTRLLQSDDEVNNVQVDDEISFKLPNGKHLKSSGPKWGPSSTELSTAIAYLKGEKPKKLRTGPKSLYYGVKACDLERVMFQLAEGCDPNFKNEEQNNQTAVHAAAHCGNAAILHLLIQAGGSIHVEDDDLETPLMVGADHGHLDTVVYLLRAGALPTARRDDGMTALHLAAKNGHLGVCKYIMENTNVDVNTTDDGGWTSLIWAAEHNNHDTVKFLVACGGNPNIRDKELNTALHWAIYAGNIDIATIFLDAGCDLECPNEHGDRVLHIAARQGHYECVILLLARGADSRVRNNSNESPMNACNEDNSAVQLALKVNHELKGFAAKYHQQPLKLLHRDISMGRECNPIPVVNDIDEEDYPQDFHYVHENIETSPMTVNRVFSSLQNCTCRDDCTSIFCMCSRNSVRCWYNKDGRLVEDFNQVEPPLIFECNKACKCWSTCRNRVVQQGIKARLQVFRTSGRGWGLRTNLDIKQGSFICEYVGEHISDAEADSREDDSYLFDLDNKEADTYCIDARYYANVARFINHLCQPNLIPVKVFVDHQDLRFPRICLFASRDIAAGEELGFDYGEKFWIIKWKEFTCACKLPKCKYSSETIQQTIADYNRRQREDGVSTNV